ncbi:type II toxin-antitoxin system RelE family toxin [Hoeflea marina]|uniref:type II toxin-antitoxin system RelE family toxin n=1 Tax=Hoeflea marina TaxID=274592 RepID=UPI001FE1C552|nr:hypothetical protein [Hoeflea marina]
MRKTASVSAPFWRSGWQTTPIRALGRRLVGVGEDIWRFRSGDIRILTRLRDMELEILVVEIGHRREIYR